MGFLSDDEVLLRRDEFNFARAFDGKVGPVSKWAHTAHSASVWGVQQSEDHLPMVFARQTTDVCGAATIAMRAQVALQSPKTKSWWDVKLDLKSPGTLLLRSPQGQVHYLAFSSLQQIGESRGVRVDDLCFKQPTCAYTPALSTHGACTPLR